MNYKGILDVISGDKSIKVEFGIDYLSAAVLAAAVFIAGLLLIIVSKKI